MVEMVHTGERREECKPLKRVCLGSWDLPVISTSSWLTFKKSYLCVFLRRLIIPGSQIVNMPGTDYTIQVTVKNFLGATNSKSWAFTKKISADTPVVSIPSGLTISYKIADGFKVPVALSASSVCGNQQVIAAAAHASCSCIVCSLCIANASTIDPAALPST